MKTRIFKKICAQILTAVFVVGLFFGMQGVVLADSSGESADNAITNSVLPSAEGANCDAWNPDIKGRTNIEGKLKGGAPSEVNAILGCGIKTGNIKLYMVPYYIRSILEFIIGISGLACVGAIVFGGYWYLFAGVSEDREKGKKAIMYGLIGMVLTLVAWAMVNIIIGLLTM